MLTVCDEGDVFAVGGESRILFIELGSNQHAFVGAVGVHHADIAEVAGKALATVDDLLAVRGPARRRRVIAHRTEKPLVTSVRVDVTDPDVPFEAMTDRLEGEALAIRAPPQR
jgi:hypothetical protein